MVGLARPMAYATTFFTIKNRTCISMHVRIDLQLFGPGSVILSKDTSTISVDLNHLMGDSGQHSLFGKKKLTWSL